MTGAAGFPPTARLRSPRQFDEVLKSGTRVQEKLFAATMRPNDVGQARLGLAISKKVAADSVDRNRIKRHVRESFRAARPRLPSMDIVIFGRTGCAAAAAADQRASLGRLWERITRQCST